MSALALYALNRKKIKVTRRREGRYLLRTNLNESDPVKLWNYYLQLGQVEEAFRTLKSDLAIRPDVRGVAARRSTCRGHHESHTER